MQWGQQLSTRKTGLPLHLLKWLLSWERKTLPLRWAFCVSFLTLSWENFKAYIIMKLFALGNRSKSQMPWSLQEENTFLYGQIHTVLRVWALMTSLLVLDFRQGRWSSPEDHGPPFQLHLLHRANPCDGQFPERSVGKTAPGFRACLPPTS